MFEPHAGVPTRNALEIDDIEGTHSRRLFRGPPKNLMDKYATVDHSRPKQMTKLRIKGGYDHMDYRDVTNPRRNQTHSPSGTSLAPKNMYINSYGKRKCLIFGI